ncbi:iron-containing alcohol dehydrogenase [Bacillus benzoevorans]|uniref:Alcohol dehydrogenase n=1 Tax=Bacillus benzoevorans TaxID=1456 RepID=A0A7X0HTN2_9BACI|nr:iron-containing alcohol dehydrogenase [Bacillus benzoevorans]MBB6446613.1 alcohol dehydrogenase [Bacillus benzoevorans]
MIYHYLPVERVHYGIQCTAQKLIDEVCHFNAEKVLIVTTNSLLKSHPFMEMVQSLHNHSIKTFTICTKQHVPGSILLQDLKEMYHYHPDLIISCGGGSPIDGAKILSFCLAQGIQTEEEIYQYSDHTVNHKPIHMKPYIPHIAIPTTLSASEFTSIAGVTNEEDKIKYKFSHIHMTPKSVFLDPVFTIDTPEWLWISTGIRAVDHAVETLYSPEPNPINSGLALQALKKLYTSLPLCKKEPSNLEYRLECQLGAWLSLFSVVNIKLGLSHSIGHQLGSLFHVPHGMTSAIMLPHVMRFLLPRTSQEQALITEVLGHAKSGDRVEEAALAPELISELIEKLEIPHRLRDFDIAKDSIPELVRNILVDIRGENNRFVLGTGDLEEEITTLLLQAW